MTGRTEIRKQWPEKRLRFVTQHSARSASTVKSGSVSVVTFVPMEAIGDRGELDVSRARELEEVRSGYSFFADGDVIVAKITPCFENGKGALVKGTLTGVAFGTTELHVLTPAPNLDGRFLYYITMSADFRKLGAAHMTGAAGQQRVSEEFVRDFRILVPRIEEQHAIVNYLDHETVRLDGLIAAKERLLGLLAEKRQALIIRAVTRGLDSRRAVRDSDISWLGKIPSHWDTRRIAWLFHERDQRCEPNLPLLEVSINAGVALREFSDERIESTAADFNSYKVARQGDVVFNKMRMWQGAVGVAPEDGLVSPDYVVAAPTGAISPQYAGLLFRTPPFSAECGRRSHGIVWDRLRLYWEEFRDISVPLPPPSEQTKIVSHVVQEMQKLDGLSAATNRTIGLLKERRSALIAAAVTGQLTVQEGA